MEYARCERILSTVPRISAVPTSSSLDMHISKVQKVPETEMYHQSCVTTWKFVKLLVAFKAVLLVRLPLQTEERTEPFE